MNFFYKYQKIIFVVLFVGIVLLFGYLLFFLFFRSIPQPENPLTQQNATSTSPVGFPSAGSGGGQKVGNQGGNKLIPVQTVPSPGANPIAQGGLTDTTQINDAPSSAPTMSSDGSSVQYYNQNDGKFYKIDKNGNITALTDKVFHEVQNIDWAPNKTKAVLEYPDGAKIVYDFNSNQQVTLPSHWTGFDFSPTSDQIVSKSIGQDYNNRWLIVANNDGTKAKSVIDLGDNGDAVDVSWSPNNQSVAMYVEGEDYNRQSVYFIGLNGENFKSLLVEGRGFESKWTPKGNRLLYSVFSTDTDQKPNLWVADAQGDNIGNNRTNLNIQTWANKCTFVDNSNVYCAVPEQLESGAGLLPELSLNTKDNIYKINIDTGIKKLIAIPDGSFTISNIVITGNEKFLYFNELSSGKLFKISLK